jgi:epimerase transport system membrane fusion protein
MSNNELTDNAPMNLPDASSQTATAKFDTDLNSHKKFGVLLFILLFGFGGIWATTAPIDGAARGAGKVTARSYSKIVQHLEGGIISNIFVENGARVAKGDPILNIDNTQPMAQLEITTIQYIALRALETRLIAERDGLSSLNYSPTFVSLGERAQDETKAQIEIFNARRAALEGGIAVLRQRIGQLQSQIVGLKGLQSSKEELAQSYIEELSDVEELLSQGFSDKNRLRELERNVVRLNGEVAELMASIASTEVQIGETRLQILQQEKEFQNQVVTELSEVQTNVNDSVERVNALEDIVSRTVVRAPESGIVNGLQVHTIGGIVGPGMRIVDIVPEEDDLIVEVEVSPNDIDRVVIGQDASIRFSTFGMGTVPTIYGTVINLSADSFINESTGISYYLARVEVSPDGMEDLGELSLMPGMPAEVFIATGSRTFFEYVFKPFSNALARGLRED